MIPTLLILRIRHDGGRTFRLYLPLLLILVLLAPFILVALVVLCVVAAARGIGPHRVPVMLWQLTSGLRGLHVDVDSPESAVFVKVI
ncbi:MAG: hypothetical protein GXX79_07300 [Actinomycetales bacterium]|nr:hypothetical protein [Actinomycetales bacterium]